MNQLEQKKSEMLEAREAYTLFQTKHSRALTDDEQLNLEDRPTFGFPAIVEEPRIMELSKESLDEMRMLELKMKETYNQYVDEYKRVKILTK